MKKLSLATIIISLVLGLFAQDKTEINDNKKSVISSIDGKYENLTNLSDKIWGFEEIAFQERQSSEALAQGIKGTELIVVEGGHHGYLRQMPEKANAYFIDFLKRYAIGRD